MSCAVSIWGKCHPRSSLMPAMPFIDCCCNVKDEGTGNIHSSIATVYALTVRVKSFTTAHPFEWASRVVRQRARTVLYRDLISKISHFREPNRDPHHALMGRSQRSYQCCQYFFPVLLTVLVFNLDFFYIYIFSGPWEDSGIKDHDVIHLASLEYV